MVYLCWMLQHLIKCERRKDFFMAKRRKITRRKTAKYPLIKGILIGLLGGLLLVLGVTFYVNDILLPVTNTVDGLIVDTDTSEKKPRLSFYDSLLVDSETVKEKKRDKVRVKNREEKKYFLQVAAFRSSKEADNLKAKLALAGFTSRIEKSDLEKDDIWYRVRLGPYESETELWATKTALNQHNFEANIVTVPNLTN